MSANVNHNMLLKFCTVHMSANVNHNMLLRFCTVYLSADVDLPCVAMQVHIDDTCLNVFVGAKWLAIRTKSLLIIIFFLQEILADITTYTSQSTCSGLGQIIFIHLISRF